MTTTTKIEWADSTFNPWEGCTKVGPGCDHCYAEARNARFAGGTASNWGPGAPRRRTSAANWRLPVSWNRHAFVECMACSWRGEARTAQLVVNPAGHFPRVASARVCPACREPLLKEARRRVFCASLADVFDNEVNDDWRYDLMELISETPNLDWLLLTKRIGNVATMLPVWWPDPEAWPGGGGLAHGNVWLGATVVNQAEADRDIPKLLATPAAVRFLSIEPMLGAVNLGRALVGALASIRTGLTLDWVIAGGESGRGARPSSPDWFGSLRDQCADGGLPFLFKQWGEWLPVEISPNSGDGAECVAEDGSERQFTHQLAINQALGVDLARVGKKAAGRLLDGIEHNGFPRGSR